MPAETVLVIELTESSGKSFSLHETTLEHKIHFSPFIQAIVWLRHLN